MTQLTNIRGIVHGRTIELDQSLSVPDGSIITITVNVAPTVERNGQALQEAFGALADCPDEVDEFNLWYRAERHNSPARLELPE